MNLEKRLNRVKDHKKMCQRGMHELLIKRDDGVYCVFCDQQIELSSIYRKIETIEPAAYTLKRQPNGKYHKA